MNEKIEKKKNFSAGLFLREFLIFILVINGAEALGYIQQHHMFILGALLIVVGLQTVIRLIQEKNLYENVTFYASGIISITIGMTHLPVLFYFLPLQEINKISVYALIALLVLETLKGNNEFKTKQKTETKLLEQPSETLAGGI